MSLETSLGAPGTFLIETDPVRRGIGNVVPWSYPLCDQAWEWACLLCGRSVTGGQRTVGFIHDASGGNNSAALPVSTVVLNIGLCFIQAAFNAAGQIDSTRVLADRASGMLCDIPEGYR